MTTVIHLPKDVTARWRKTLEQITTAEKFVQEFLRNQESVWGQEVEVRFELCCEAD
jgi:hypothetical protein